MFTNSCWIFATSLFVKTVGSKGYSQLFFFASLAALLYYLYFAFRGHKDSEPYNIYRGVLFLAFGASLACFLKPNFAELRACDDLLLYFFVVSVMTVDLVGTTLGPIILQASVNPIIFRQVYQKIVAMELTARIIASGVVWFLSQTHQMNLIYPFAWILLIAHFFLFGVTVWRMRVSLTKPSAPPDTNLALKNVMKSISFIFKNPLVRVATSVMVWSTVTKFVLENLFYQVTDKTFTSAPQLASFISALTIVIYALSLCLHPLITRLLNARLQLTSLLSIQPLNILAFAGLALLLPPFWPLVLLMVTYNIVHRSIQMPMSRQCLVPVPQRSRGTIVSLISILIALSTMATSGVMALMKNALHFEDYVVFLLVLGAGIMFMVTSLDSYYIRNLWSLFQEIRSGQWQEEQQLEGLSMVALDDAASVNAHPERFEPNANADLGAQGNSPIANAEADVHGNGSNADGETCADGNGSNADVGTPLEREELTANFVLESYSLSHDKMQLARATAEHLRLLSSNKTADRIAGLRICFIADFPWLREPLAAALHSGDEAIRVFAEQAARIDREIPLVSEFTSMFRRRVRTLALEFVQHNDESSFNSLKNLYKTSNHAAAESLLVCLSEPKFQSHRSLLLDCVSQTEAEISIQPIVNCMYLQPFIAATEYRELLDSLPFGKLSTDLRDVVKDKLDELKRNQISFKCNGNLDAFMHTLYLEEYRLSVGRIDKTLADSISEFTVLSNEESGILVDMHLSFLKRSELFATWEVIMASLEPSAVS